MRGRTEGREHATARRGPVGAAATTAAHGDVGAARRRSSEPPRLHPLRTGRGFCGLLRAATGCYGLLRAVAGCYGLLRTVSGYCVLLRRATRFERAEALVGQRGGLPRAERREGVGERVEGVGERGHDGRVEGAPRIDREDGGCAPPGASVKAVAGRARVGPGGGICSHGSSDDSSDGPSDDSSDGHQTAIGHPTVIRCFIRLPLVRSPRRIPRKSTRRAVVAWQCAGNALGTRRSRARTRGLSARAPVLVCTGAGAVALE